MGMRRGGPGISRVWSTDGDLLAKELKRGRVVEGREGRQREEKRKEENSIH